MIRSHFAGGVSEQGDLRNGSSLLFYYFFQRMVWVRRVHVDQNEDATNTYSGFVQKYIIEIYCSSELFT